MCQIESQWDLIIIGAGPAGLACATYSLRAGLKTLVLEKGCIVNSIFNYPESMTFFTTADLLEIGDVPMTVAAEKPKRQDALKYYRRVVEVFGMEFRDYEQVLSIEGSNQNFTVTTKGRFDAENRYSARKIVVATGYFDNPNLLGVPGEDLPKVTHYYRDPHPYYRKKVAVVGGKNSAAIAALELFRNGADVTLIHRGTRVGKEVKYWIRPDLENRIRNGEIKAYYRSSLLEIHQQEILVQTPKGIVTLANDFVLAMTGYHPDPGILSRAGVEIDPDNYVPTHDPDTLETNVKGIYLAGSIVSGRMTNRVFIENGRFHGSQIIPHLLRNLPRPASGDSETASTSVHSRLDEQESR